LIVSHHQSLALGVELLVVDAPGIALAGELGIAPIGFLEISLSLSEVHALLPFSAHRIVPFGII
jgi:hypothetical protein